MEWISVKDKLPEETGFYLCCDFWDDIFTSEGSSFGFNDTITHWMPLPEPPQD